MGAKTNGKTSFSKQTLKTVGTPPVKNMNAGKETNTAVFKKGGTGSALSK